MKCPKCDTENAPTSRFCAGCGTRLDGSVSREAVGDTREIPLASGRLGVDDLFAGKYRIVGSLGKGGMGVVYKAEDIRLGRMAALKVLPSDLTRDPDARRRFIQEAQAASALDHGNICTIYEIGEDENERMYIAMAYYSGETLKQKIEQGPLEVSVALGIAIQAAHGLCRAHEAGITHRDLKPANIIVTDRNEVKIIDFGLAKLGGQEGITKAGTMMGTVMYMSPEQARGDPVDARADVWSLGVLLYEMLTGQAPFRGDRDQAVIYSILNREPEPVGLAETHVPAALERIVKKAMRKTVARRYQSVEEMLADLMVVNDALRVSDATQISAVLKADDDSSQVATLKPVAVISFENLTGDTSYDYLRKAIPNLLITSLEQSRYLRVITWERMQDLLKQSGRGEIDIIDKDSGFDICVREGVDSIVLGSYTKAGEVFATDVKVLDVASKSLLKSASSRGMGVDSILQTQIDELSREISLGVGLSERKIHGEAVVPIAEVTTKSMKAYEYFLSGREAFEKLYNEEARRALEQAVETDPGFAVAHLYLGWVYGRLRETAARDRAYLAAREFSDKATKKERLYIEASIADVIEHDLERRRMILEQMTEEFPGEKRAHHLLASHYRVRGLIDRAVEEYNKVLELDPDYGWAMNELAYIYADAEDFDKAREYFTRYASLYPGDANPVDSLGELYFRMGRLDDAIDRYAEALRLKPDFYYAYWETAYVHALKEDYAKALAWIDRYVERAPSMGTKATGSQWRSFYLLWQGRLDDALAEARRLRDIASDAASGLWKAEASRLEGWIYLEKGDTRRSRDCFARGLSSITEHEEDYVPAEMSYSSWTPERIPRLVAGYEFAKGLVDIAEGAPDSARSNLEKIGDLLPGLYGILLAEILLAEGAYDECVKVCEGLGPWPVPYMSDTDGMLSYNLPPRQDILGRALLARGDVPGARREYGRLAAFDPQSRVRQLIHPTYHLGLAEVCRLAGDEDVAEESLRKYRAVWKGP